MLLLSGTSDGDQYPPAESRGPQIRDEGEKAGGGGGICGS